MTAPGSPVLVVIGFPSNDFMKQEPGSEHEIQKFCRLTYSVNFPMFEKVSVTKGTATPLFERLAAAGAPYPKWNFYKYLIDRNGDYVDYFASITSPAQHFGLDPHRDLQQRVTNLIRSPVFVAHLQSGEYDEPVTLPGNAQRGRIGVAREAGRWEEVRDRVARIFRGGRARGPADRRLLPTGRRRDPRWRRWR